MQEELVNKIQARPSKFSRKIVFVCGIGGSGKTSFSNSLQKKLGPSCVILRHDWYHKHSSSVRKDRMNIALASKDPLQIEAEENPANWYDQDKFLKDLKILQNTGELHLENVWEQKTGENIFSTTLISPYGGVIIVDGIYLLHNPIQKMADFIIMLQITPDVAKQRRKLRDSHRSSAEYLERKNYLMATYDLPYLQKNKENADVIVDNNAFSSPKFISQKYL